jgi:hypothetical protein
MRSPKLAQPPLDHRRVGQDPATDRDVVDLEATFPGHFFQIAIAERIAQIPGHCLHYEPCLKMPAFEIIL